MVDVAIKAAEEGGKIALSYFKNTPKVTYKPDNSPVTIADKEAEKAIRAIIRKQFPDHGIIGEEGENINPNSKYQWIIDPIDGTRAYIRNIPQWCTLVALLEDNKPIIGVCNFQIQNQLFSAQKGMGTFVNGKKTSVSKVKNLEESYVSYYNVKHFNKLNKIENLIELSQNTISATNIASFSLNYLLSGKIEAYICGHGSIWDYAAPSILVEEAGGKFTDFNGQFSLTSETAVFSNGLIHKEVLNILNKQ